MTTTTAPAPLPTAIAGARTFGKCAWKGCKARIVVAPDAQTIAHDEHVTIIDREVSFAGKTRHQFAITCTEHGDIITPRSGVKATTNTTRCDARCKDSAVEVCKCSCGGANHGETFGGARFVPPVDMMA